MLHMMEVVVPLHIHVEKMKEIVILTIIAKVVLIVAQIIAQLDSTSLPMLTVAHKVKCPKKSVNQLF